MLQEILEGRPTLLDLLEEFTSCKVQLGPLLDALPALPARMYSVACSPLELPKKVSTGLACYRLSARRVSNAECYNCQCSDGACNRPSRVFFCMSDVPQGSPKELVAASSLLCMDEHHPLAH